jgi:glycosyltransferase involved in cell wall biosynthesis
VLGDPELAKRLGRAGKERAREMFLTPRLLGDWLKLFGDLGL